MKGTRLSIYVEGLTDQIVVRYLLEAANLSDGVDIVVCKGKRGVAQRVAALRDSDEKKFIALVDADVMSVSDSQAFAQAELGHPSINVYCAVPTIEAWLFADDITSRHAARGEQAARILERTPLPEMIAYPKQLAFNVFHKDSPEYAYQFLKRIDIRIATARSPSLRTFLLGVAQALGRDIDISTESLGTSVSRDALSTLLRELPGRTVAWRTMDGTAIHADELAKAVTEGTDIGRQYVTEVLRIARDMIVRRSRQ